MSAAWQEPCPPVSNQPQAPGVSPFSCQSAPMRCSIDTPQGDDRGRVAARQIRSTSPRFRIGNCREGSEVRQFDLSALSIRRDRSRQARRSVSRGRSHSLRDGTRSLSRATRTPPRNEAVQTPPRLDTSGTDCLPDGRIDVTCIPLAIGEDDGICNANSREGSFESDCA